MPCHNQIVEGLTDGPIVFCIKFPGSIKGVSGDLLCRDVTYNYSFLKCKTLKGVERRYTASKQRTDYSLIIKADGTRIYTKGEASIGELKHCKENNIHKDIIKYFNL
jgi:hypothetical protein